MRSVNAVLEGEAVGYRLLKGQVVQVTETEELKQLGAQLHHSPALVLAVGGPQVNDLRCHVHVPPNRGAVSAVMDDSQLTVLCDKRPVMAEGRRMMRRTAVTVALATHKACPSMRRAEGNHRSWFLPAALILAGALTPASARAAPASGSRAGGGRAFRVITSRCSTLMKRIGLAVLMVLSLAAARGRAGGSDGCGEFNQTCCAPGTLDPNDPSVLCDAVCIPNPLACSPGGKCLFADGVVGCSGDGQCASGFCQFSVGPKEVGTCVQRNPAPAVSNATAGFIGAVLLFAGLWSVRRVARRR